MFPRIILIAFVGAIVGAGSFFGTLTFLDYANAPPPAPIDEAVENAHKIRELKSALIYDEASLRRAADNSRLEMSPNLMGVLDVIERVPGGQVRLAGWVADKRGDGTPVRILAFAKGKPILEAETSGERPDVTAAFQLNANSARNVKFELQADCKPREALVIAAANNTNLYLPLKATVCP